jgi:thiol:disulfide interchange protein
MRLRADWSDFDKDVTNLMKKYNKIQAPANILFGPLAKKGMLLKTYQSRTYIEDRVNNVKENKKDIFLK